MSRFGSLGTQYLDDNGDPLSAGTINFYEKGTLTPKTTYSDEALTVANPDPVVLDAAGRQPDVFFDGEARAILKNSSGTTIEDTDPVGESVNDSGIGDWSSSATYDIYDLVKGSDSLYYLSVQNSNTGNDPTTPSPSWWMQASIFTEYNSNYNYLDGNIVVYDRQLWISQQDSNQGNTPAYASSFWIPLARELRTSFSVKTAAFNFDKGKVFLINSSGGAFAGTLPANPDQGDRVGAIDVTGSWKDENFTIARAASGEQIMNLSQDIDCDVDNAAVYLEYTGTTYGWVLI